MRESAVDKANAWTAEQATRLGVAPAELLQAITGRGWLPEQIEALPIARVDDLTDVPLCRELADTIARIASAPILPVPMSERAMHALQRSSGHRSERKGSTAMETAFARAKDGCAA